MRAFILALLSSAASAAAPTSFSCAISTITLKAGEPEYDVCTYSLQNSVGFVSFQWFTGTFGKLGEGSDSVLIRMYIDGEASASVSLFPYELAGTPSVAAYNTSVPPRTWSAELWGRNSATSWINSFPVPFASSIRITLQFTGASGAATTYYQAHGLDGVAPTFGRVPLPAGARLVLQRNDLVLDRLAYLNVSSFAAGGGLVAAISIAFVAPNLNTLEGCFHFYPTASTPYPGQLHSTGTEDEFISSSVLARAAARALLGVRPSPPARL
jgi:hypothetical protein